MTILNTTIAKAKFVIHSIDQAVDMVSNKVANSPVCRAYHGSQDILAKAVFKTALNSKLLSKAITVLSVAGTQFAMFEKLRKPVRILTLGKGGRFKLIHNFNVTAAVTVGACVYTAGIVKKINTLHIEHLAKVTKEEEEK